MKARAKESEGEETSSDSQPERRFGCQKMRRLECNNVMPEYAKTYAGVNGKKYSK